MTHVVLDPDAPASTTEMVMLCKHCGTRGSIKLPIAAAMIGEASRPFILKHAACRRAEPVDPTRAIKHTVAAWSSTEGVVICCNHCGAVTILGHRPTLADLALAIDPFMREHGSCEPSTSRVERDLVARYRDALLDDSMNGGVSGKTKGRLEQAERDLRAALSNPELDRLFVTLLVAANDMRNLVGDSLGGGTIPDPIWSRFANALREYNKAVQR